VDRDQRRWNAGEELHGPDRGLAENRHQQDAQPQQNPPRRVYRQQPEAKPDQQGEIGDQQR
jgi:hypothetical protein